VNVFQKESPETHLKIQKVYKIISVIIVDIPVDIWTLYFRNTNLERCRYTRLLSYEFWARWIQ